MRELTLGSLFDGSGGFPLGGLLCGIRPVWAAEIEPFPIRVTTKRMPFIRHLGDVSHIDGALIEPVDIITFGSPCTDLSVAGKRAGLSGSQSGLFHEAIRIVRQMREATNGTYPKYIVWENVPGAFSSNRGQDFKAVLDAIVGIVAPGAEVPAPADGKWPYADVCLGTGWSVAYRVVDAQYFGVAQRRRRIYLVASFVDERAGEILFEREGVCRDFTPCASQRQTSAGDSAGGPIASVGFEPGALRRMGGHAWPESTGCLRADMGDNQTAVAIENHPIDGRCKLEKDGLVQTLAARMGTGGMNVPLVMNHAFGVCSDGSNSMRSDNPESGFYEASTARTLDANGGRPDCNQGGIAVVAFAQNQRDEVRDLGDVAGALSANAGMKQQTYALQGSMIGRSVRNGPQGDGVNEGVCFTLNTSDHHAVCYPDRVGCLCASDYKFPQNQQVEDSKYVVEPYQRVCGTISPGAHPGGFNGQDASNNMLVPVRCVEEPRYAVRRLTPEECARLQGFPDWWCADLGIEHPSEHEIECWQDVFETHRRITGSAMKPKTRKQIMKWLNDPYTDAAEYKLWGNGVALPCVVFVLSGILSESAIYLNETA